MGFKCALLVQEKNMFSVSVCFFEKTCPTLLIQKFVADFCSSFPLCHFEFLQCPPVIGCGKNPHNSTRPGRLSVWGVPVNVLMVISDFIETSGRFLWNFLHKKTSIKQCWGSGMFILDPGSWFLPIPDPKTAMKDRSHKFQIIELFDFSNGEEKNLGQFSKNYWTFYPKNCH